MGDTVDCRCGKRYSVPDDSAGRTFQCKRCGETLTVPGGAQSADDTIEAWILQAREAGESRGAIRRRLVEEGFSELDARAAIDATLGTMSARPTTGGQRAVRASSGEGGLSGCVIWIGILVLVNVLSAVFDWPFWVY